MSCLHSLRESPCHWINHHSDICPQILAVTSVHVDVRLHNKVFIVVTEP